MWWLEWLVYIIGALSLLATLVVYAACVAKARADRNEEDE